MATNLNDNQINQNIIIDFQEYFLLRNDFIYKFVIYKRMNDIIIKCKNYEINFVINDLTILTKSVFKNLDDAYIFVLNLFEENQVLIKNIKKNKEIILSVIIYIHNKKENVNITLNYEKNNKDFIIDELNCLKEEITILKKELNELKPLANNSCLDNTMISNDLDEENFTNPNNIKFLKDIVNDSNTKYFLDNTFSVFKSIDNILYLIYTNNNKSIISYNLLDNKIIKEIKDAHNEYISNFRHYLDNINQRDLILSISCKDNNIKVWDVKNFQFIVNIENINTNGELDSACFLTDNNQNFIVSCNDGEEDLSECIKVFDFNGKLVKEMNNSNDISFSIDSCFDKKLCKNYIITTNCGYAKSYDYTENKLYNKYNDNDKRGHSCFIVYNNKNILKLMESSNDGNIRVWHFHTGNLLEKIKVSNYRLFSICLWNEDYLLVGCENKSIKLVELKNRKIIKNLAGHTNDVVTIRKIFIPQYGECLISQGWNEGKIKIWNNSLN